MFPPSLSDLLSPSASLCFISRGTAHTVLVAQTHSDQQGQEASVLVTMPAASNLICQTVPFSKFNLREIQMIIHRLLQRVRLQSRIEPHAVTGSEENQRPPRKQSLWEKWKHLCMLCKQETEYLFRLCLSFTYGCYMKDEIDRKWRKLFRTGFWLNRTGNENVNRSYVACIEATLLNSVRGGWDLESWVWLWNLRHLGKRLRAPPLCDHGGFRQ